MYKLYSIAGSCSTGITILLKKLGIPFEVIQRSDVADYSSIVPTNQVPALEDNGNIITEGAAIVIYLLEKHQNSMMPTDIVEKGEFLRWLMFNYATLHPSYSRLFAVARNLDDQEAIKQPLLQKLAHGVSANWKIINDRLESREYIVGDQPSVIDYLATIYTSWAKQFSGINITYGINVERLVKKISILPEFKEAYAFEGAEFKM